MELDSNEIQILGTTAEMIDRAEDRSKFSALLDEIGVDQPEWSSFITLDESLSFCEKVNYPVLVRPSYVLSGAGMKVVYNQKEMLNYLKDSEVSSDYPVVITKFIEYAKEIEVDGVAHWGSILAMGISEHIENAGVHSGDATLILPAQKLYLETVKRIKKVTRLITQHLSISGPFNIQFLSRDNHIKVIECNLRASRSFPFVSKTFNTNFIELATRIMLGLHYDIPHIRVYEMEYVCVKSPMFSFPRLPLVDPILGVEMASTGEVAAFGEDLREAYLQSMISAGFKIPPSEGCILLSVGMEKNCFELLDSIRLLIEMNYRLLATPRTCQFFQHHGLKCQCVEHPMPCSWSGGVSRSNSENTNRSTTPNTTDLIRQGHIHMVLNIPTKGEGEHGDITDTCVSQPTSQTNGYRLRRIAIDSGVPLLTNVKTIILMISSLHYYHQHKFQFRSWSSFQE